MENIKVSVVMPVYNVQSCLDECLDTLERQTLKEIEIICVDDGSTDLSLEILREHSGKDPRIKVLTQHNSGAAVARNRGFEEVQGEYVIFLDSDDFYKEHMLKTAYDNAKKQNTDITVFRTNEYDTVKELYNPMEYTIKAEQLPLNNPFTYHDIPDNIFTVFVGWAWDKLYKTEFIRRENIKFQNLRTSNDLFFVFSSLIKADGIYVIDEPLVYHRVSRGTSLSVTREKSWDCFYKALTALKEELERIGAYEEVERGFLNWVLHFGFWNLDSITGPAFKNVYRLLKEECYISLGMDKKPREYYHNEEDYDRMMEVLATDYDEYVFNYMIKYRAQAKELKEVKSELHYMKTSTTFKVGRLIMGVPIKIKKIIKKER